MKRPATILIGDRNPYVRMFLQREMSNSGYQVLSAENGRQIFFWIEREPNIDLIILDPDMPDMDALTLCNKIHNQFPHLPIVIHSHPGDEVDGMQGDGIWFVEKRGNSIEGIIEKVGRALGSGIHSLSAGLPQRPRN